VIHESKKQSACSVCQSNWPGEFSGDEVYALGIPAEILDTVDLHARARERVTVLTEAYPVAVAVIKNAFRTIFERDIDTMRYAEAEGQGIAFINDYRRETTRRFIEKRPLRFSRPDHNLVKDSKPNKN
jgi:enoyl-CoA hydratase/carnithine racemase